MRPPTVKSAKRRAWNAFAAYIRARDPYCVTHLVDGKYLPTTEAGHFIHNSDKENKVLGGNLLWFDERNVNGQDFYCNRQRSGMLSKYAVYLEKKYGKGIITELYRLYNTPKKWTIEELLQVEKKYITKLALLQESKIC